MPWQLTDEDRVAVRASLKEDWLGTLIRIDHEVARYALNPVHRELQELRMKATKPAKRWELVKQTQKAIKSIHFLGKELTTRDRNPELVLEHLAILMENDLFHPASFARVIKE